MIAYESAPGSVELHEGAKVAGQAGSYSTICRYGFTLEELAALQRYCLEYSTLVKSGRKPTPEQDARFLRYAAVCYRTGAAHVKP
jgi:hypothetical protein